LLLRDLLKHTSVTHTDFENIKKANELIQKIATKVNETVRKNQKSVRMIELGMQSILAPHRYLIRDSTFEVEAPHLQGHTFVHFFLLNDVTER